MSETPTTGTGPAAGIRWDLSHLYPEPSAEGLESDLDRSLLAAKAFGERFRGRIGGALFC